MNLKAPIYRSYFWYFRHFPLQTGKSFLGRCLYKGLGPAVFNINGVKFELSPEGFIDKYLLHTGEFDGEVLRQVKQALKDGGTFIDVGANFGYYTIVAASLQNTKVIAFEPSPREANRLQKNILLNDLQNVQVHQLALSDKEEELFLHLTGNGNAGMNSLLPVAGAQTKIAVHCKRLDQLIDNQEIALCTVIKIDVEGFEFEVLKGMGDLLSVYKGMLIVEINNDESSDNKKRIDEMYAYLLNYHFVPRFGKDHAHHFNECFSKEEKAA